MHEQILRADVTGINKALRRFNVNAGVPAASKRQAMQNAMIALSSHCGYRVAFAKGVSFRDVEKYQREILASVAASRRNAKLSPNTSLRFSTRPEFVVELDSPVDRRLDLPSGRIHLDEYMGLIGRRFGFTGAADEHISLTRHHHTLIAALSGHGKSTVMRSLLSTMLYCTSPERLKVLLIDLKNDDLPPFQRAPHALAYAGDLDTATQLIAYANDIKEERIQRNQEGRPPAYRLLIAIDELAELNDGKNENRPGSLRHTLASLMKTGRSLGINVVAATQYPSSKEIGASVVRAFTHRIVGRVDSATTASFVAGRAGTGAEQLIKPGSFIRIGAGDPVRFQGYFSTMEDTRQRVSISVGKWRGHEVEPLLLDAQDDEEPEADPTAALAEAIREMWESGASKNSMCKHAIGKPYAGSYAHRLDEAIALLESEEAEVGVWY